MLGVEVLEPVSGEVVGQLGVRRRADEERVPRRQHLVRETGLGEVVDGADRTAQPVASLEHHDAPSGTRQQCRGGQRVDPRTHENCVGAGHAPERTTRPGFVYMIKRMLPREVAYARPGTVDEAVRLLGAHDGARALAGGQTLVSVMKQRAAAPEVLVDLADLSELRSLARSADGASLEIGAMVTYSELIRSPEIAAGRPAIGAAARTIADVQVQNRGTIGGNVCLADPTNHFPPLLTALGATFTIRGASGERTVPADEFFVGVYWTAVGEGELLTRITVPLAGPGIGDALEGVTLGRHGTYIVSVAASVTPGDVRIALGCVAAVPERAIAGRGPAARRPADARCRRRRRRGPRRDDRSAIRRARVGRLPSRAHRGLHDSRGARCVRTSEGVIR